MESKEHSEIKHTPGPWKISELNDAVDGEEDIMIEYEGFPLCEVRGTNDMSCIDDDEQLERINQEVIANAKLIAAAPELLQALIDLEKANPNSASWDYPAAMESARRAIKKATL